MLNQTLLKYFLSWCATLLACVAIHAQTIENQRLKLDSRSRLVDKHYYLDSLITFSEEGSETNISAHILKAEILKSEEKYVNALSELILVSTDVSTTEYPDLLGLSYLQISEIYIQKGSFDEAKKYLVEAYTLFNYTEDQDKKAAVLIKSAHVAKKMSDYDAAISHLQNAHSIYQENGKTFILDEISREIGTLAYEAGEFTMAKEYLNQALFGFEKRNDYSEQITIYEALSKIYDFENNDSRHIEMLEKVFEVAEENSSAEVTIAKGNELVERAHKQLVIHDSLLAESLANLKENGVVSNLESDSDKASQDLSLITKFSALDTFWKTLIAGGFVLILGTFITSIFILRKKSKEKRLLEWKVFKRTKEIRTLNAELNTYIYRSSHDLRNPLTSIKSLISLLLQEGHNESSSRYLGLIEKCTDQMDEILLNLSRAVDYKKVDVEVEQVSFNQIRNEIEGQYAEELKGLTLDWNIREKAPFFSDPNLIKVILNKTITNSIQYRLGSSADYCKISIITDSKGAHVSIEDNGQGISEKVKDRVFNMFEKGTHKSKGAGLGLYLVKIVSEKIRAKITLESRENQGAKLDFKLPNLSS